MKTLLQIAIGPLAVLGIVGVVATLSFLNAPIVKVLTPLPPGLSENRYSDRAESNLMLAQRAARKEHGFRAKIDLTSGRTATVANIKGVEGPNDRIFRYGDKCELAEGEYYFQADNGLGKYVILFKKGRTHGSQCPSGTMFFAVEK